jgi:hypothetical protein
MDGLARRWSVSFCYSQVQILGGLTTEIEHHSIFMCREDITRDGQPFRIDVPRGGATCIQNHWLLVSWSIRLSGLAGPRLHWQGRSCVSVCVSVCCLMLLLWGRLVGRGKEGCTKINIFERGGGVNEINIFEMCSQSTFSKCVAQGRSAEHVCQASAASREG